MSNQTAMQQTIDLTGVIDLNKNKNTIRQFDGFTKRNSPFINGGLSPLISDKRINADIITKNGKTYSITGNGPYKLNCNGVDFSPEFVTGIIAELKINPSPELNYIYIGKYNNKDCWIYAEDNYIKLFSDNTSEIIYTGSSAITELKIVSFNKILSGSSITPIMFKENSQYKLSSLELSNNVFSITVLASDYTLNPYGTFILISGGGYYIYNGTDEYTGNSVNIADIFTGTITDLPGYNVVDSKGVIHSLEATFTDNGTYTSVTFKGEGQINISGGSISVTFPHPREYKFYKTINSTSYVYATSIGSLYDVKLNFNGYFLSWSFPVTLSNGKTMYFFNEMPNGQITDDNGEMSVNLKLDRIIDASLEEENIDSSYGVLINNNELSGISYNGILLSDFLGIDNSINWPYLIQDRLYYQTTDKNFVEINLNILERKKPKIELLYDNYIIIKGISKNKVTVYDIKNRVFTNISSDWNNRVIPSEVGQNFTLPDKDIKYILVGSGHNVSYENGYSGVASSQFGLSRYRYYPIDEVDITSKFSNFRFDDIDTPINYGIDLYYTEDETIIPFYVKTIKNIVGGRAEIVENIYIGTTYPVQTEGNILLNPSFFNKYFISGLMTDTIKSISNDFYKLIYSDAIPVFLYAYSSNIRDVTNIFFIQGQAFIIRNDVICSVSLNGNILENVSPIVNKGNLQFLGCSPLIAYFYSITDRFIYIFTGDRNLQKYIEISEFTEIKNSLYLPDIDSLLIATDNGLYVIDSNNYIYCVEGNFDSVTPLNNGYAAKLSNENKWNKYYYYNDEISKKEKVVLKTSFYGVGNNQLSVIDTWYIKLYSENKINGNVKIKLTTITNKTTKTDTQDFIINANDWDDNGFIYIRYQPQYQRSIGSSIEIISDFEIFDLQASILPDNTKQLSADYRQNVKTIEEQNTGI